MFSVDESLFPEACVKWDKGQEVIEFRQMYDSTAHGLCLRLQPSWKMEAERVVYYHVFGYIL